MDGLLIRIPELELLFGREEDGWIIALQALLEWWSLSFIYSILLTNMM